jgi:hypothetical protein
VPDPHNATDIRRALEAGAEGIFLPEIRSIDDINTAAQAAFFPPKGDRGICPSVRAANFNFRSFNRYADWNNRRNDGLWKRGGAPRRNVRADAPQTPVSAARTTVTFLTRN